jgi:alanyl-tRNA synthetase
MLGNFSFGDYFKKEACKFGWEFLIEQMKLDADRMYITVFRDDDEAYEIWRSLGIPQNRIFRMDEKDNYWAMGDTGPQGPCSELIYDQGPSVGCGRKECDIYCGCDRFLELWNLVFMQFNKDEKGNITPLPKPSIDTGMGLERISAVVQGVHSNYDSDLFQPIIRKAEKIAGIKYGADARSDTSLRVIADHARATAFLIADGELPSNSVRGYVLRRIMRRAARHGKLIGMDKPFLFEVADAVIDTMKDAYPELVEKRDYILKVVLAEEERFLATLDRGLAIYKEESAKVKESGSKTLPGEVVFKLYDTYGFPSDLTALLAKEDGLAIDQEGFEAEMEQQRERARASSDISAALGTSKREIGDISAIVRMVGETDFVGYETTQVRSKISAIIVAGAVVKEVSTPGTPLLVFSKVTPFYAEAGGQVGDRGWIKGNDFEIEVTDTFKATPEIFAHEGVLKNGSVKEGDEAVLIVDFTRRMATARNHTATHLLQAALRQVLGTHVHQRGSKVEPDRFRFDFSHFHAMTGEEIEKVENLVNEKILENIEVEKLILPYDEALRCGAMALFGEKYGDVVRMIQIDEWSRELCGGTHVNRTGDIGLFKIVSESAIGSGERRIVGLTGKGALEYFKKRENALTETAEVLKEGDPLVVPERVRKLQEEIKRLKKELQDAKNSRSSDATDSQIIKEHNGIKILATRVNASDPKELRESADRLMERIGRGVVVVGAEMDGKASLTVKVSRDLTDKIKAGDIVRQLAEIVGGKGGGRPDMAQAGGPNAEKLDEAIKAVFSLKIF